MGLKIKTVEICWRYLLQNQTSGSHVRAKPQSPVPARGAKWKNMDAVAVKGRTGSRWTVDQQMDCRSRRMN